MEIQRRAKVHISPRDANFARTSAVTVKHLRRDFDSPAYFASRRKCLGIRNWDPARYSKIIVIELPTVGQLAKLSRCLILVFVLRQIICSAVLCNTISRLWTRNSCLGMKNGIPSWRRGEIIKRIGHHERCVCVCYS